MSRRSSLRSKCSPSTMFSLARRTASLTILVMPLCASAGTYVLALGNEAREQSDSGVSWSERAFAQAESSPGVGKIVLRVDAYEFPTAGYPVSPRTARAEAVSGYRDSVTFNRLGAAVGTKATVTFGVRFNYSGRAGFSGGGQPGVLNQEGAVVWSMIQSLGGKQLSLGCSWNSYAAPIRSDYSCSGFDSAGQSIENTIDRVSFQVDVAFGEPTPLSHYLTAIAGVTVHAQRIENRPTGSVVFDMGNSFYWDGIDEVTVDGVAVDYTLSSESGADYRVSFAPVPEPGTVLMWTAGLGLLATWRLRRRLPNC